MLGGTVIGIVRTAESTLLNVENDHYPGETLAIRVLERRRDTNEPISIGLGDAIWWQGQDAMWTPKALRGVAATVDTGCGLTWDIHLPRLGSSH